MVRTCKIKGCNVREGQGKQLFRFPPDERRSIWISRTGRRFWQPGATSCICEDHFDATQWETVRVDGSRRLRRLAVPTENNENSATENNENISFIMHDHTYVTSINRRQSFRDITMQVNRLAHDYVSVQSKPSEPIQAAESQARTNNITVENVPYQDTSQDLSFTSYLSHNLSTTEYSKETSHELSSASFAPDCNSNDHNQLFILANICATSKLIHIPSSTACPASTIQELQDQLNKQKVEIEALQRDKKLLNAIAQKATKKFYAIKSAHDKYRLKLWRSEKSKAKAILALTSRLRADQIASIGRQSNRGIKWSSETIKDALVFKMKWGTTGYSDFVNYLPIFPSVRTLQRVIEHIKFESDILDEVFDMLKCATESMSENERDCVIVV